jgi:predicted nucleotidyltransferase component of viral defense system
MVQVKLTPHQDAFLKLVGREPSLSRRFYWTGGTVLATQYLDHRISDDIDLFTEEENVNLEEILVFLRYAKSTLGYETFDIETSFNRNLVFLRFASGEILKTEFTSYPFQRIEKSAQKVHKVMLDSPKDIAVNKLFTINQKPRGRDYIDLYFLMHNYSYQLHDLMKLARLKFDWHIDPIQLGSRLVDPNLDDWPVLLRELEPNGLRRWLCGESRKLEDKVFLNKEKG